MIKHIAAVAVVLLTAGYASAATSDTKYELKRIPMGPRPDNYVLVRIDRADQDERPYALTGEREERRAKRPAARPTPSHPKGTHGQF
jgi:hypothetical protein